jgi:hypothetical protein
MIMKSIPLSGYPGVRSLSTYIAIYSALLKR